MMRINEGGMNKMNVYRGVVSGALALMASSALAAQTLTWSGAAGNDDWTDKGNYEEDAVPSAGDIVKIPDGKTATVSSEDAASWSLASSLNRIAPQTDNSKIILDVAEGTSDFYAGISMDATYHSICGTIEKTGAGTVAFHKASGSYYDYRTKSLLVSGGTVDFSAIKQQQYFKIVTVAEGAVFKACNQTTWVEELKGLGEVTAVSDWGLRVIGGKKDNPTILEPKLTGSIKLVPVGTVRILRTDNTFTAGTEPYPGDGGAEGLVELIDIGMKSTPSPTGKNTAIYYSANGNGKYRYIGETDTTTDKNVLYYNSSSGAPGSGIFDAGAHGGITFNGTWGWTTKSWGRSPLWGRFVLKGTNASPCVINGTIGYSVVSGLEGHLGMLKQGAGKWTFANAENFFDGTIGVEGGTLGFTSLFEKGRTCALGTGTHWKDIGTSGLDTTVADVPYAIRLGAAATSYPAEGLATLEYAGADPGRSTTRPLALAGDARLSNASTGPLTFADVTPLNAGTTLLALNGAEAGVTNYCANLRDASATQRLGIVKEGAGTYVLYSTNTCTGPLVVKAGTLILRKPTTHYTWFRLVVRRAYDNLNKLGRVGLFDADGYRRNIGLKYVSNSYDKGTHAAYYYKPYYERLEPGQFGWGCDQGFNVWEGWTMASICNAGECWDDSCHNISIDNFTTEATEKDPTRWLQYDFRLAKDAPAIAYYDLATVYGTNSGNLSNDVIRAWSMMGSTDGLTWDELHRIDDLRSSDPNQLMRQRTAHYWLAQNIHTSGNTAATKHNTAKLQPIASAPTKPVPFETNYETVSVAPGARLVGEGDITLSNFKVDASASGVATIEGIKVGATATIDIDNMPRQTLVTLPLRFTDTASADAATWTCKMGGKVRSNAVVTCKGGAITVRRSGFLVMIK